ncbi:MAG: hypothetical protein DRI34_04075, partial [Deltaproteobacteria bacterium]
MDNDILHIWSDGAARGNPGPAGAGVVIARADGEIVEELSRYLGETTNNVAEYQALLLGLERALQLRAVALRAHLDSQLVVRQLQGSYRVRQPHLRPLYQRALEMLRRFEQAELVHVPR